MFRKSGYSRKRTGTCEIKSTAADIYNYPKFQRTDIFRILDPKTIFCRFLACFEP